ncbi:MAG: DUF4339 domain-containing protein [Planctomycetes bacterium]|nr:DUF4339 domain-containing protein [Planctomycetota bacterium]
MPAPQPRASEVNRLWFYEMKGERIGPIVESDMRLKVSANEIGRNCPVWANGMTAWARAEESDLARYFVGPPPLTGQAVNNTWVWVLAFAPVIGTFIEGFVGGFVSSKENLSLEEQIRMMDKLWWITVLLNIILGYVDERVLRRAGHNTASMKGFVWLVPVYLYKRAELLHQNLAYFIVWLVMFGLVLLRIL